MKTDLARILNAAIGKQIRLQRKSKGMTQKELAACLQITEQSVGRIEMGMMAIRLDTLYFFAKALGVQPSVLLPDIHSVL
jgi:transcriptional regulator with XRE-family HTH domain